MVGKEFRNALREGKKVYGTQISSTSPKMFDSVISLGLDFVFFCNEHVQYNPETLSWMCNAFKAAGVNPLVRILEPSPYLATQALDAGACTVLVPYVEEIEDVIISFQSRWHPYSHTQYLMTQMVNFIGTLLR
jgi:4-hydroxy-2-oxoheptanedioate aldolase